MTNLRKISFSIFAAAVLALCLPVLAAAQRTYDPYSRNRDYGRDGDWRRDRGYDNGYGRYDDSHLEDVSSHHFENDRLISEWSQISQELRVISEAYGDQGANHGENRN